MSQETYCFSFYVDSTEPRLVRRPWWNVFGRDRLEIVPVKKRVVISDLNVAEADILKNVFNNQGSLSLQYLLVRLMGRNPEDIQLEVGRPATEYIPTCSEYVDLPEGRESLVAGVKYH
jgi:hypothetical protein